MLDKFYEIFRCKINKLEGFVSSINNNIISVYISCYYIDLVLVDIRCDCGCSQIAMILA